ncbi:CamS family sex pheromone protein [Oceanobacillus jeddahense]|uniref:CamS family sex pheromone protein n=1 Tax=Oceanobacillus jeddahense TaxID=1462527 RepID=A0ABY5K1F2_9BACI|nr:CamS family sex pheromone protein [Oceanobacillus jeddahense]UUI04599.1 CamS family sex pheromone protein [Oceanobacillus jeddahense]
MKKWIVSITVIALFLSGCVQQSSNEDEVVQDETGQAETSIVPSNKLSEENYRMILPYQPSEARGVITNQVANRVDIDEMEEGLRRLSKDVYDPEDYYFQEGQYFDSDRIYNWISELNPEVDMGADEETFRENPRYLTHVLEQNYLTQTEDGNVHLEGISIGLAMKSVYQFQTDVGEPYLYEEISESDMMEQATEIAEDIVSDIRENDEELSDVPIMIGIYREEEQSSPVPGNFVAQTNVAGGSSSIDGWEDVEEENILFPSDEGQEKYYDDQELVTNFANEISDFFPNYVGMVGEGFYIDEELQKLRIDIPIEFYGKGEVIGFTQYVYGLIEDMFPNYYDIEVNITSSQKNESLLYRNAGEDEIQVHIYD